jgi:putative transposase
MRFKSKTLDKKSFSLPQHGNTLRFEKGKFRLPKMGLVDGKFTRFVKGKIKQCTVSQTRSGKYYLSILSEEADEKKCTNGKVLGIDMAFHGLAVLSTGEKINAPRWYYDSQERLGRAYRDFSRTVKGSKRHERARLWVARVSEHIANQRLDYLHKLSRRLADEFETIKVEDVDMRAMAQHRNWGKKVNDLGFGMFRQLLAYKAANFVVIDKMYPSSQLCSCCGYRNEGTKDLSVREWTCPECGAHHDRDVNAALNIRNYNSTVATTGTGGGEPRNARGEDTIEQLVKQSQGNENNNWRGAARLVPGGHHRKAARLDTACGAGVNHNPPHLCGGC